MSNRSFHTARGSFSNSNNSNSNSNSNSNLNEENVANLQAFPNVSAEELVVIQKAEDNMMHLHNVVGRLSSVLDGLYEHAMALAEQRKQNKSKELRDEYNRVVDQYNEMRATWLHYKELLNAAIAKFQPTQKLGGGQKKLKKTVRRRRSSRRR
jgi:hypothetical protein